VTVQCCSDSVFDVILISVCFSRAAAAALFPRLTDTSLSSAAARRIFDYFVMGDESGKVSFTGLREVTK
jgi:hypothetical protein